MGHKIKRALAALLLLLWLPAGALALTGQDIGTFQEYYKEDISFINSNTGRHLLPKDLNALDLGDGGRVQYYTYSDTLQVTVVAGAGGIIESCEIRLLYPEGAVQGNSLYQDFNTASFHSLAFIMAMHVSADPTSRFYLGEEIKNAMIENHGVYDRQLGAYSISCIGVIGEGAVYIFTNNGLMPAATGEPATGEPANEQDDTPQNIEEDEAANYG